MEKACKLFHPDGLRHYGMWLRANSQNLTSFDEIAKELNHINANSYSLGNNLLPHMPTSRDLFTPSPNIPVNSKIGPTTRNNSPIPCLGIQDSVSPIPALRTNWALLFHRHPGLISQTGECSFWSRNRMMIGGERWKMGTFSHSMSSTRATYISLHRSLEIPRMTTFFKTAP